MVFWAGAILLVGATWRYKGTVRERQARGRGPRGLRRGEGGGRTSEERRAKAVGRGRVTEERGAKPVGRAPARGSGAARYERRGRARGSGAARYERRGRARGSGAARYERRSPSEPQRAWHGRASASPKAVLTRGALGQAFIDALGRSDVRPSRLHAFRVGDKFGIKAGRIVIRAASTLAVASRADGEGAGPPEHGCLPRSSSPAQVSRHNFSQRGTSAGKLWAGSKLGQRKEGADRGRKPPGGPAFPHPSGTLSGIVEASHASVAGTPLLRRVPRAFPRVPRAAAVGGNDRFRKASRPGRQVLLPWRQQVLGGASWERRAAAGGGARAGRAAGPRSGLCPAVKGGRALASLRPSGAKPAREEPPAAARSGRRVSRTRSSAGASGGDVRSWGRRSAEPFFPPSPESSIKINKLTVCGRSCKPRGGFTRFLIRGTVPVVSFTRFAVLENRLWERRIKLVRECWRVRGRRRRSVGKFCTCA